MPPKPISVWERPVDRRVLALGAAASVLGGCSFVEASAEEGEQAEGATVGLLEAEHEIPGSVTVAEITSSDRTKAPFRWLIGGREFGGTFDAVSYFGYNIADQGDRVNPREPSFTFNIEQDYLQGDEHTLEAYWEFVNVDGAVRFRPLFWQFGRDTGDLKAFVLTGNRFTFREIGAPFVEGPLILELAGGGMTLFPGTSGGTQLVLQTGENQTSNLALTRDGRRTLELYNPAEGHAVVAFGDAQLSLFESGRISVGTPNSTGAMLAVASADGVPPLALASESEGTPFVVGRGPRGQARFSVTAEGEWSCDLPGRGFFLRSPKGTKVHVTVTDDGDLVATPA